MQLALSAMTMEKKYFLHSKNKLDILVGGTSYAKKYGIVIFKVKSPFSLLLGILVKIATTLTFSGNTHDPIINGA